MCVKGICPHCIPVEIGCLILGIISAIFTGLALLASLIYGIYMAVGLIHTSHTASRSIIDPNERARVLSLLRITGVGVEILFFILVSASFIAFLFSVLLCNGICKRRPGQVRAYYIYGVVTVLLIVVASWIHLAESHDLTDVFVLIGCGFYSLFLVLVRKTYLKLCDGVVYNEEMPLVADCIPLTVSGHTVLKN